MTDKSLTLVSFSGDDPRKMFRGHLSASEIIKNVNQIDKMEDVIEGSCGERCEPFGGADHG